jgi:hypothetical protein
VAIPAEGAALFVDGATKTGNPLGGMLLGVVPDVVVPLGSP